MLTRPVVVGFAVGKCRICFPGEFFRLSNICLRGSTLIHSDIVLTAAHCKDVSSTIAYR